MSEFIQNGSESPTPTPVFGQGEYKWHYGKRNDKVMALWPLSMSDQLNMTKLIVELFGQVSNIQAPETFAGVVGDSYYLSAAIDIVGANIETIVALVADMPADDPRIVEIKSQVTNDQLLAFVQYVWETNFASVRKNYSGLFDDIGKMVKRPTVTVQP